MKANLLDDDNVWGTIVAAKFARYLELPHGNYWEPVIARTLAAHVHEGKRTRDEVELLMALQLGIATARNDGDGTVTVATDY